jgi:CheY-like chemotaxis protein
MDRLGEFLLPCIGEIDLNTEYNASAQRLSVLVVEDDKIDYINLSRALDKIDGFSIKIDHATSISEADALLSKGEHDIIFVDYFLAGEIGLDVLEILSRSNSSALPILLSGLTDKKIAQKAQDAGAVLCLNKNEISPSQLSAIIAQTIQTGTTAVAWMWSGIPL